MKYIIFRCKFLINYFNVKKFIKYDKILKIQNFLCPMIYKITSQWDIAITMLQSLSLQIESFMNMITTLK